MFENYVHATKTLRWVDAAPRCCREDDLSGRPVPTTTSQIRHSRRFDVVANAMKRCRHDVIIHAFQKSRVEQRSILRRWTHVKTFDEHVSAEAFRRLVVRPPRNDADRRRPGGPPSTRGDSALRRTLQHRRVDVELHLLVRAAGSDNIRPTRRLSTPAVDDIRRSSSPVARFRIPTSFGFSFE